MSSAHPNRILPECDLCSRRANRLKYALHLLDCVRKSYPEDSSLSDGFAVAAAQRYVDEVLWSHPEHPLVSSSEADSTRSSGRGNYSQGSAHQTKEQREPQSCANRKSKSHADSDSAKAAPKTADEPAAGSESDETTITPDEVTLRGAFLHQAKRVEEMMEQERRLGMIAAAGHKEVDLLRRLGLAILKLELKRRK